MPQIRPLIVLRRIGLSSGPVYSVSRRGQYWAIVAILRVRNSDLCREGRRHYISLYRNLLSDLSGLDTDRLAHLGIRLGILLFLLALLPLWGIVRSHLGRFLDRYQRRISCALWRLLIGGRKNK